MKKNYLKLTIYGLTFMTILSSLACTPEYLDKQALNDYLLEESNGLSKEKSQGDLKLKVTYRPTDLLIEQELGKNYEEKEISTLRKKYEPYAYFMVKMESGGQDALYSSSAGQGDFSAKLQTLSFRMGDYVNLTTSAQDTIPVADYAFPRTFGIAKSTNLMFVFNREKMKDQDWVSFNLNEFGLKAGDQRFRFKLSDLNKVPKLKFKS